MSSRHFIQQIYLYPELSPQEKRMVDAHVRVCESCRQRLSEFMASQSLLKRVAETKAMPGNAARLTGNIMAAVQMHKPIPQLHLRWLDGAFVRYGMMTCSLVLLTLFVKQELIERRQPDLQRQRINSTAAILNTSSMLHDVRDKYLNKNESKSWYACLKEGGCDERSIKKIKSSYSVYEKH